MLLVYTPSPPPLSLQVMLEIIMIMQNGRSDPYTSTFNKKFSRINRPLLENAPFAFAEAVIGLVAELIAVTSTLPQSRSR